MEQIKKALYKLWFVAIGMVSANYYVEGDWIWFSVLMAILIYALWSGRDN